MLRTILTLQRCGHQQETRLHRGDAALYRLGAYIPAPGVDVDAVKEVEDNFGGSSILGFLNLFSGGSLSRLSPVRAGDHALHHGLDHPAAADRRGPLAGAPPERGRGRPAEDHPVHALPDRRPRLRPVARLRLPLPVLRQRSRRQRRRHPHLRQGLPDRDLPHRRLHPADVARRADHPARHRQRHLADDLRLDRSVDPERDHQTGGTTRIRSSS